MPRLLSWLNSYRPGLLTGLGLILALLIIQPTSADTVQSPIPVGAYPWGVAVNPVTNKIYVANHNSGSVIVTAYPFLVAPKLSYLPLLLKD